MTMTPRDFVYWLQGYMELTRAANVKLGMTPEQVTMIESHLGLVLTKVTYPVMEMKVDPDTPRSFDIDPFNRPGVTCCQSELPTPINLDCDLHVNPYLINEILRTQQVQASC